jgi:hypothetical protein
MENRSDSTDRTALWAAAKLAVRRYSHDPSDSAAADVSKNLQRLRDLPAAESGSFRALRLEVLLGRGPGTGAQVSDAAGQTR